MTQISTGDPYIAREVHEAMLEVKDGIIMELFNRIEKLEGKVAELEARQNKRYVCADGEVDEALTEEPRLKVDTVNGKLVPWSNERAKFFEPWSKLGLDSKIPMEPGEGYEFLPHGSPPEEDDEFWHIEDSRWTLSGEAKAKFGHHSKPSTRVGPYRRKIKQPAPSTVKLLWYSKDGRNFRVCQVTGEHVEMTAEREEFFKPWLNLGVLNRVPLVPGEGYEFVPHGAMREPDDGAEFWQMTSRGDKWVRSRNKGKIAAPSDLIGPYRRKIKPSETVLVDPKTLLVDSHQAYPLPKCPRCNSDPVWTSHNDLHRIGCSACPDFSTSPTKSIKQAVEWWTKMCEPIEKWPAGMQPVESPKKQISCPAATAPTVSPEVGKRYFCRNGKVTEPMERRGEGTYPFTAKVGPKSVPRTWMENGRHDAYREEPRPYDLVAEYIEPRMKKVTLREYLCDGTSHWTTFENLMTTGRTVETEVPE